MKKIIVAFGLFCIAVIFSSCAPAHYVVGGTIPSANVDTKTGKAPFSLYADTCSGSTQGTFTYHDRSDLDFNPDGKGPGLQMTGTVESAYSLPYIYSDLLGNTCSSDGTSPINFFTGTYYSTNKEYPGSGTVYGCFQDNGQGSTGEFYDTAGITVSDGPYEGYTNVGEVQGNTITYPCQQ